MKRPPRSRSPIVRSGCSTISEPRVSLSARQARRIALAAQHLASARPASAGFQPACRSGGRRPRSGSLDPAAAAADRGPRRGADQLGERAGARPLPAGLLAARALRSRPSGGGRLGQPPVAVRVLGARGVADADWPAAAVPLAHGAGQSRRDLDALGALRPRAARLHRRRPGQGGARRAPHRRRPRPWQARARLVELERRQAGAGVAVLGGTPHRADAQRLRAGL